MKRAICAVIPLLLLGSLLSAAEHYGEAVINEGKMTIIRDGETLQFETVDEEIPVFEEDLLRLRSRSQVVLVSREKATMTLGSNAVFQVKPWEVEEESGFLRALYGKFRSVVAELAGDEQFNIKTPTATIGIKGTEFLVSVTSNGNSMLVVTQNIVQMQGPTGPPQLVGQGFVSVVVNGQPATPPAPVPPQVSEAFSEDDLDSPPANEDAASEMPGEDGLVETGVVEQGDLDGSNSDDLGIDDSTDVEIPDVDIDLEDAKDNVLRGEADIIY